MYAAIYRRWLCGDPAPDRAPRASSRRRDPSPDVALWQDVARARAPGRPGSCSHQTTAILYCRRENGGGGHQVARDFAPADYFGTVPQAHS